MNISNEPILQSNGSSSNNNAGRRCYILQDALADVLVSHDITPALCYQTYTNSKQQMERAWNPQSCRNSKKKSPPRIKKKSCCEEKCSSKKKIKVLKKRKSQIKRKRIPLERKRKCSAMKEYDDFNSRVSRVFYRLYDDTAISEDDDLQGWVVKFSQLDAITEAMVQKRWQTPPGRKKESCKRIMITLGGRWILCFARCVSTNRLELSRAIHTRILQLKALSKEREPFETGFDHILRLSRYDQPTMGRLLAARVLEAYSNIYRMMRNRRLSCVKLKSNQMESNMTSNQMKSRDYHAGKYYRSVRLKDSIMLPCLKSIQDHVTMPFEVYVFASILPTVLIRKIQTFLYHGMEKTSIGKRCNGWSTIYQFYENPCIDHWNTVVELHSSDGEAVGRDDVNKAFGFLKQLFDAEYTLPVSTKQKFETIVQYTLCFVHIGLSEFGRRYPALSTIAVEALAWAKKGVSRLLVEFSSEYHTSLIFQACTALTNIFMNFASFYGPIRLSGSIRDVLHVLWPTVVELLKVAWRVRSTEYAAAKQRMIDQYQGLWDEKKKEPEVESVHYGCRLLACTVLWELHCLELD